MEPPGGEDMEVCLQGTDDQQQPLPPDMCRPNGLHRPKYWYTLSNYVNGVAIFKFLFRTAV